jgi:CubicO group peptidase (beta-lactamase class C family)
MDHRQFCYRCALVLAALHCVRPSALSAQASASNEFDRAYSREARAAFGAHNLCAGLWVVGRVYKRSPAQVLAEDIQPFELFSWERDFTYAVDSLRHAVTVSAPGIAPRVATYNGDQGCSILPRGERAVHFTPVPVRRNLPDASTLAWPMGEANAAASFPEVNQRALDAALDWTMAQTEHRTRALVVVYRGKIVGERYAPGWTKDTPQIGWSQGKSITAALVGILVGQGAITLDVPAPIAEWRRAGDPRREITVRHLLNMSSGLDFLYAPVIGPAAFTLSNKHLRVYSDGLDVFAFAIGNPLIARPNTRWSYQNSDPLALGKIIDSAVTARRESYLAFPQRSLFDRIGIRSAVLETDAWGHFILSGFDYMSARDWARFGLLHLLDGVWNGQRILPEGWVKFVTTPAPAAPNQVYGGLFWLNRRGELPGIPHDAYWCDGAMGQYTLVIPSRDLVIVRLGPSPGAARPFLADIGRRILAAIR